MGETLVMISATGILKCTSDKAGDNGTGVKCDQYF
jgi:hypothetical protein